MITTLVVLIIVGAILAIILTHLLPKASIPEPINSIIYWTCWIVYLLCALDMLLGGGHTTLRV